MKAISSLVIAVVMIFGTFMGVLVAGTTGKIVGKVTDAESGQPLVGVNVIIEGTTMGAATDLNGNYIILNVPPGAYALKASMIGFKTLRYENVRVSIDLTTTIDFKLSSEILDLGEEVTVVAERPMVTKDLTATTAVVSSEQMAALPVTEVNEAIELQAGIVKSAAGGFHIRGGRSGEVSFWIDGMPVTDVYDGGTVVDVNKNMVQELQVISGAFNAEYGQAMSGIVNIATKGGSNKLSASFHTYFGDYTSNHTKQFLHIDRINPLAIRNFEGSLNGAIIKDKLFYFVNARHVYFDGWLYGQRKYNPNAVTVQVTGIPTELMPTLFPDYAAESRVIDPINHLSGFQYIVGTNALIDSAITADYLRTNNISPDSFKVFYQRLRDNNKDGRGDGKFVSMNWNRKMYGQGKLIYKFNPLMTLSYDFIYDDVDYQDYDRNYKFNPDGALKRYRTGFTNILKLNHLLSSRTYYTLGLSYFSKAYKHYVYEDKYDPRYIHPDIGLQNVYSYKTGGTDNNWFQRQTNTFLTKFDLTSQVTKNHEIKSGLEFRLHRVSQREINLRPVLEQTAINPLFQGPYIKTRIPEDSTIYASRYHHQPLEFSAYVQDKMEFKNMIINLGVRFDYFEPDGVVLADESDPSIYDPIKPQNRYYDYGTDGIPNTFDPDGTEGNGIQDPGERLVTRAEREKYWYKKASPKLQLSPRLGVSFPITERGVIHFSYGHFFQIPRFERLYQNPDFQLGSGTGNVGVIGNADLKPEQTINGEIGLQQQLGEDITLHVTGYFRDIRDLAGTRAEEIVLYGGFAKYSKIVNSDFGFVRGLIVALNKRFSGGLSASMDYTLQTARGSNSNPEQARNALEAGALPEVQLTPLDWDQKHTVNATLSYAAKSWGGSVIAQWGSGFPYTPRRSEDISSLLTNSQRKPTTYNVDLRAYKDFRLGPGTFTLFLRVFNLFDTLNEINVYDDTGRAGFTVDKRRAESTNPLQLINSLDDWFTNPTHFSEPRRVEFGLTYTF